MVQIEKGNDSNIWLVFTFTRDAIKDIFGVDFYKRFIIKSSLSLELFIIAELWFCETDLKVIPTVLMSNDSITRPEQKISRMPFGRQMNDILLRKNRTSTC